MSCASLQAVAIAPTVVALYVNNLLQQYGGGVFPASACDNSAPNHMALVVGYSEAGGYWKLKNSELLLCCLLCHSGAGQRYPHPCAGLAGLGSAVSSVVYTITAAGVLQDMYVGLAASRAVGSRRGWAKAGRAQLSPQGRL